MTTFRRAMSAQTRVGGQGASRDGRASRVGRNSACGPTWVFPFEPKELQDFSRVNRVFSDFDIGRNLVRRGSVLPYYLLIYISRLSRLTRLTHWVPRVFCKSVSKSGRGRREAPDLFVLGTPPGHFPAIAALPPVKKEIHAPPRHAQFPGRWAASPPPTPQLIVRVACVAGQGVNR